MKDVEEGKNILFQSELREELISHSFFLILLPSFNTLFSLLNLLDEMFFVHGGKATVLIEGRSEPIYLKPGTLGILKKV